MLASSGVTRNMVIMYPTQGWSLYHRMGRVYYQNIWLQKRQNVWELFGMFKNINIYFTKKDSQRVPMCVVRRLVLFDKVDPCCRMGRWGSCNIVTFLSLNMSREETRVSWTRGKCCQLLVKQFSLGGHRSELCCESASFCCSFGGEVFDGDIVAVHPSGSALIVNVLMARIDNLSETGS